MKNSSLALWQSAAVTFNNIIHSFKFKVGLDGSKWTFSKVKMTANYFYCQFMNRTRMAIFSWIFFKPDICILVTLFRACIFINFQLSLLRVDRNEQMVNWRFNSNVKTSVSNKSFNLITIYLSNFVTEFLRTIDIIGKKSIYFSL